LVSFGAALAAEVFIETKIRVGRGEWVDFRLVAEACFDWVPMEIVAADVVVGFVVDAVVGESSLPDGEFGAEAMREAAFDKLHCSFERDVGWGNEEMKMVGHDDVGVEMHFLPYRYEDVAHRYIRSFLRGHVL
jgi:hypothetical protein